MVAKYYTHYPRTTLWLIQGDGELPSFYLSKLPISNRQLEAFRGDFVRSPLSPGDDDPACGVDLATAQAYAAWYAEVSRKPMRLPTLGEWQLACRGGGDTVHGGEDLDDAQVWHAGNSGIDRVPPLDGKKANAAGLFAMLGGVWEWALDDGAGEGDDRPVGVLCGGSFRRPREAISWLSPVRRAPADLSDVGFRLAKSMR